MRMKIGISNFKIVVRLALIHGLFSILNSSPVMMMIRMFHSIRILIYLGYKLNVISLIKCLKQQNVME